MPRKTITTSVCTRCLNSSCSGEVWEYVSWRDHTHDPKFETEGVLIDMDFYNESVGSDGRTCPNEFDVLSRKNLLNGFSVGDEVSIRGLRAVPYSAVILRKVMD